MKEADLNPLLRRIADALERLAPAATAVNDLAAADAFIWHADREWLEPVPVVNRVALGLLRGIDRLVAEETGLPVHIADDQMSAVAEGTGRVLQELQFLKRVASSSNRV